MVARGSRSSLVAVQPMPRIIEDDDSPPPTLPEKSYRRSNLGRSPRYAPSSTDDSSPDRRANAYRAGLRDQEWFARRGGWYRFGLIILLFATIAAGLGVGLTIGFRHNSESTGSNSPSNGGPASPSASPFPFGSYSFVTALTSVSTACTSNSDAFSCYPYTAYNPADPDASAAKFTWIITAPDNDTDSDSDSDSSSSSSPQYLISAAPNPFVPQFANLSLTLLDEGQPTERLTFNYTMSQQIVPATPLVAGQTATTTCWYNSTVMTATLWTRRRATYPANITSVAAPTNASDTFAPWPYDVEVLEVQAAGAGVPDCQTLSGESVGSFAVANPGAADVCGCSYSNFQLSNSTTPLNSRVRRRMKTEMG